MNLDTIMTALKAKEDLKIILEAAEKAKENLFNSNLEDTVFTRTYQMINNIVREAQMAIENINIEFDRVYSLNTGVLDA